MSEVVPSGALTLGESGSVALSSGGGSGGSSGSGGGQVRVRVWAASDAAEAGQPSTVLVGLHGLSDSADVYETLWSTLQGRWTVLAVDAPGHGERDWTEAPVYDFTQWGREVVALLQDLGVRYPGTRYVTVGHSVGAVVAAQVAGLLPDLVTGVVLEEPPRRPLRPGVFSRRFRAWLLRINAMPENERVDGDAHGWLPEDRLAWARAKPQMDPRVLDVPSHWGDAPTVALRTSPARVLLVLGAQARGSETGMLRLLTYRRAFRQRLTTVRIGGGHNPRRSAPQDFAEALRLWLAAGHP